MIFRRRYGMLFALALKERPAGTGRGCRAVVAARLLDPGSEWRVLRALQFANFTTPLLLDDDEQIRHALRAVPGIDADTIVDRLDDHEVTQAYEGDRAEARTAVCTREVPRLIAAGCQPILAYDVLVANLDPAIRRTPPPKTPEPVLERFPDGLTTAEVAALLAQGPDYCADPEAAEQALLQLVAGGEAVRVPLGQDALWRVAHVAEASVRE